MNHLLHLFVLLRLRFYSFRIQPTDKLPSFSSAMGVRAVFLAVPASLPAPRLLRLSSRKIKPKHFFNLLNIFSIELLIQVLFRSMNTEKHFIFVMLGVILTTIAKFTRRVQLFVLLEEIFVDLMFFTFFVGVDNDVPRIFDGVVELGGQRFWEIKFFLETLG
tara:strand:+ start:154 stop:639 length:486 start_codon:yes stop_codon:yes gene_type:complete